MKKILLASVLALALFAIPASVQAAPPGFYGHGRVNTFSAVPTAPYFNPYGGGMQTFNTRGFAVTPWGVGMYNYGGTFARPYVMAPYHSVYWNPFMGTYQYGTGYMNTPMYYSTWGFGW